MRSDDRTSGRTAKDRARTRREMSRTRWRELVAVVVVSFEKR